MATPTVQYAAAFAAGVVSYPLYFGKGEHHFYGTKYLQAFFLIQATAIAGLIRIGEFTPKDAFNTVFPSAISFLVGIYSTVFIYRAFFHPLNKIPGPFGARISNLWFTSQVAGKADARYKLLKLHAKYGDFMRIGSNDLSIIHPDGIQAIYGLGTKCTKADWYDGDAPMTSMHTTRAKTLHDKRRRIWSPAFSDKALRGYESRIEPYSTMLRDQLSTFDGKPVNVTDWFQFFAFDVMGDLAFGESFDMLSKGEEHWAIKLLGEGMEGLHLMLPTWAFRLIAAIPGATRGYWRFINYCGKQLDKRMQKKESDTPDIMASLLTPFQKTGPPQGDELSALQGDARLIIVAGSDTTAATLTHLFYHLCKEPKHLEALRNELDAHVDPEGNANHIDIMQKDYLNGCINEALRLNPPVPSAIVRLTPPEGITIGDTFIPGGMKVWCPQFVLNRSEKAFERAEEFIPERWSSKEEMVRNKGAFAPFSAGVYACIGKPLALLEMRTVIAKLVTQFDIKFAQGEDGSKLYSEGRDHFTLTSGPLNLTFTKRTAKA